MQHELVHIASVLAVGSALVAPATGQRPIHPSPVPIFRSGDLVLATRSLPTACPPAPIVEGIILVTPTTGRKILLRDDLRFNRTFNARFDPYRERLIMRCEPDMEVGGLYGFAADGSYELLVPDGFTCAPVGDGRIYFVRELPEQIRYLDGRGGLHVLLDESGSAPFVPPCIAQGFNDLLFDPGTNALFGVSSIDFCFCDREPTGQRIACLWKIPLSPRGDRVSGPTLSIAVDSTPMEENSGNSLSPGPDGQILLLMGTSGHSPSLQLVDPVRLNVRTFASPSPGGVRASVFSHLLDKAVILDTLTDVLRGYSDGGGGLGTIVATCVSGPAGCCEAANMCEIP